MSNWKTILKRSALALVAAAVAMSWTQTGQAQAPCVIERGQDPLDVLNTSVRHNVWILLDTSASMQEDMQGNSPPKAGKPKKLEVAKEALKNVINNLVDSSGKPLVNWGYVKFGDLNDSFGAQADFACNVPAHADPQFTGNQCQGLDTTSLINPPACGVSNVAQVQAAIAAAKTKSNTPNGVSIDQISKAIVANGFVAGLLAQQKNFVINVSDGDDTCECGKNVTLPGLDKGLWTPTASPPLAAVNVVPRSLRGNNYPDSSFSYAVGSGTTNDVWNTRAINTGTKGRLLYERLNPLPADRATGAKGGAFVIGLGLGGAVAPAVDSPKRANHLAWEASGAFYGNPNAYSALFVDPNSSNPYQDLEDRFNDAFARIGIAQSTVTLGTPIVGTVREVIPQYTNTAVTADQHIGDVDPATVDADDIREARTTRANHQNNVVFSTSVDLPEFKGHFTAHAIYKVTDPKNPRTAREAFFQPIWEAGDKLQNRPGGPDSRNILFNKRGQTALLPFNSANVTAANLGVGIGYLKNIDGVGALTANDARDMVVGVVRGYYLAKDPLTNKLYRPDGTINFSAVGKDGNPTWKLYDAIAGPAVIQNPGRSPDVDPPQNHADKYGVGGSQAGDGFFYWDHFNRETMAYLPTNDGMMHAFDAETGDEVFAYIPDDVMGFAPGEVLGSRDVLSEFVELVVAESNSIANHQFLLASSPTVYEAFLRGDNQGDDQWHTLLAFSRGRGGRFVSALDITDPSQPKLRFNTGNREGINDGQLDGLGETWSLPVMGNVQTTNPGSNPDRGDQWLLFLGGGYGCNNPAKEGQYLFALRAEDGAIYYRGQVTNNAAASITYNAVVAMPVLYNPHQADVADNKDFVTRVYVGDVQGVIWKLVTSALNPATWDFKKFAELGTNQPITAPVALLKDVNNQQVYVMAGTGGDLRVSGITNTFKFAAFVDKDAEGAATTQYPLGSSPFWQKTLNAEERVYVAPVTVGRVGNPVAPLVFFAASKPTLDLSTCTTQFFSTLYALGILSGQAEVDLDGGGKDESVDLGVGKVTGLYARNKNVWVSQSGGIGTGGSLTSYGDGKFSDDVPGGGGGPAIQILVDSFRISPF